MSLLIPPVASQPATYERTEYPAFFGELPIGTEFTTPAVPKCRFRKSVGNHAVCVTVGKENRSQDFFDNAGVYPIGWTRPEPVAVSDNEGEFDSSETTGINEASVSADGCGTDAGIAGTKKPANPVNPAGGQRTAPPAKDNRNPGQSTQGVLNRPQGQPGKVPSDI